MQKIFSSVTRQIQDLAIPTVTKDYKLEGTIGKGNFSVVKRATDRKTGKEVAVKVISLDKFKSNDKVRNNERPISNLLFSLDQHIPIF
jgi:serine/threonine protein kinase